MGIYNAVSSIKNCCITYREFRAQLRAQKWAHLTEECLVDSTAFTGVGKNYFFFHSGSWTKENAKKQRVCCSNVSLSNGCI